MATTATLPAATRLQQQLRIIALFEDLADPDLARVAAACTIGTYGKHEQVLGDHDRTTDVFFVLSGSVRVNSYAESGREVIFSEVGAGDIFGEFAAVDGLPRSAAVVAQSDCVLARMSAAKFLEILRSNGAVSVHLVELLVAKIRRMSERVFEVSALAVRERVRRELLRLAATKGTEFRHGIVIRPAPTHYEIAASIGSHREAVTREFNRLEEEQIIEVRRQQIRIVDIAKLREGEET
jgi:CRP-like cAMP-binding protein